jgi:hypothetical protein
MGSSVNLLNRDRAPDAGPERPTPHHSNKSRRRRAQTNPLPPIAALPRTDLARLLMDLSALTSPAAPLSQASIEEGKFVLLWKNTLTIKTIVASC